MFLYFLRDEIVNDHLYVRRCYAFMLVQCYR